MITPGVVPVADGVHVAVSSAHAELVEFCLFRDGREQRFALRERSGEVWHGHVPGIDVGDAYGLRAHGPWAPEAGHRFNPAKLLLDPYALAIDRRFRLRASMFGHRDAAGLLIDSTDSAADMPKAIVTAPSDDRPLPLLTDWADSVIYELHVRGFSMRNPAVPAALHGTFAGLGHPASIAYLSQLGVTAVELLPTAAWIEERHLAALGLENHWGYNSVGFMAPDPRLAPGGWAEVRAAVTALAYAGIETILDVVLNHTGEGDELGPTLSLRGLDNSRYYRLRPDAPQWYVNDTGCGNTLALDRPPMLDLAMESLRSWAQRGGVHGFRFDLAATLGRREAGFDTHAPLIAAIGQDPVLRRLKLIAEPWDLGPGGYQTGRFPAMWGEWNDRFRDDVRSFWRGDSERLGALATRLAGSADVFAGKRRPSRSVNFVVAHDGFTLADLVAHGHKHNSANGEGNRDGTDDNVSWNNGCEGATEDPVIRAARLSDQRALLATLLFARGTPMLAMGSEFGQSQGGNNNAYAQDNAISWLDWAAGEPGLLAWTRRLIALRHAHPALRQDLFLTGLGEPADVAWHAVGGGPMRHEDWAGDCLVMALVADAGGRVCVTLNRSGQDRILTPPDPRPGHAWSIAADSAMPEAEASEVTGSCPLRARSVLLLVEVTLLR